MNTTEITSLFDQWNAALQTGEPKNVAALYETNAILLPTVSNKVRHTHAEIEDYFVAFLAKGPREPSTSPTSAPSATSQSTPASIPSPLPMATKSRPASPSFTAGTVRTGRSSSTTPPQCRKASAPQHAGSKEASQRMPAANSKPSARGLYSLIEAPRRSAKAVQISPDTSSNNPLRLLQPSAQTSTCPAH